MEKNCYHCGKSVLYGRTHTHHRGVAGGRWKKRAPKKQKIFRANFVRLSILEKGVEKRIKLCTKCLKRVRYDMKKGVRPFLVLADTKKLSTKPVEVVAPKVKEVKKTVKKEVKKAAPKKKTSK